MGISNESGDNAETLNEDNWYKFGFPESLKCHLFGINQFYKA
jgi:hypothetical protein